MGTNTELTMEKIKDTCLEFIGRNTQFYRDYLHHWQNCCQQETG